MKSDYMRTQKYKFRLTEKQRTEIQDIINIGDMSTEQRTRAEILLASDDLYYFRSMYSPQEIIASRCGVSTTTVYKVCKKYVEGGLNAAINRKKREKPPVASEITAEIETKIVALAYSAPPDGYKRWTLRLMEKKVNELGIAEHISDTTIGRILKGKLNPLKQQ